jgi:hypothetical protein
LREEEMEDEGVEEKESIRWWFPGIRSLVS